jgi:hypothetical protein
VKLLILEDLRSLMGYLSTATEGAAMKVMKEKCADCPFGRSAKQLHMRHSLKPGRFKEICQAVWQGGYFPCHKTTEFDDDGESVPSADEKVCRGSLEFLERAAKARDRRYLTGRWQRRAKSFVYVEGMRDTHPKILIKNK